jgi:hypothetical protein
LDSAGQGLYSEKKLQKDKTALLRHKYIFKKKRISWLAIKIWKNK